MRYRIPDIFIFSFICLLSLHVLSCKNKEKIDPDNEVALYDTKEFNDFYERFGKDSVYQMQHIVFPLEGIRPLKDRLDVPDPNFKWQENTWVIHGAFDDLNGQFNREFISMKGIVVERISDKTGAFSMERRFARLSSGWNLIYYREMGKY